MPHPYNGLGLGDVIPAIVAFSPPYAFFLWLTAKGAGKRSQAYRLVGMLMPLASFVFTAMFLSAFDQDSPEGEGVLVLWLVSGAAMGYELVRRYRGIAAFVGWLFLVPHSLMIVLGIYSGLRAIL